MIEEPVPEMAKPPSMFWQRTARIVSVFMGIVFAAGVVTKVADWENTVHAMTIYSILDRVPPLLPAVGSLIMEFIVAVTLLAGPTWRRYGLLSCAAFWAFTGVILIAETLMGGSGDCGCMPFLPRDISWFAALQNLSTAFFLVALWKVLELENAISGVPVPEN
jgi:hypothetical protein